MLSLRSARPSSGLESGAKFAGKPEADAKSVKAAAVHLKLVGANAEAEVAWAEKLPGMSNY